MVPREAARSVTRRGATTPDPRGSRQQVVTLLGRSDRPNGGLEDYCECLSEALSDLGYDTVAAVVPWVGRGRMRSLRWLWRQGGEWRGSWVLVQHSALQWSRRGLPVLLLPVLLILRLRGARVGVVLHDPNPFPPRTDAGVGVYFKDRLRGLVQRGVMACARHFASVTVLTLPPSAVRWARNARRAPNFIPVGANLPGGTAIPRRSRGAGQERERTVAVYGVTGGSSARREVREITRAMSLAADELGSLKLVALGAGSNEARWDLEQSLRGSPVEVAVTGIVSAETIKRTLAAADVLLFVRGEMSTRRGTVMAALACGLPVVGYAGPETLPPLTEAGIVVVRPQDVEQLAAALTAVLGDASMRATLRRRSLEAFHAHFSWGAIASRYARMLHGHDPDTHSS